MKIREKPSQVEERMEIFLTEAEEVARRFLDALERMKQAAREPDSYDQALADASVALFLLKMKSEAAHQAIEDYIESLPQDE